MYEKVHTALLARFGEATGLKRRLIDWALGVGRRASTLEQAGKPVPSSLRLQRRLAHRLVYQKVHERFGGRLRGAFSGGAPLSREIIEFFDALGIRILEGYGLTEVHDRRDGEQRRSFSLRHGGLRAARRGAAPRGGQRAVDPKPDDLRGLLQGLRSDRGGARRRRLAPLGRHRGDRRRRLRHDHGPEKDIIVTAGGKNIAPQNLENDLKTSRYVSQALVVGDRRPYPAALITLDPAELTSWAAQHGLDGDLEALAHNERVRSWCRSRRRREPRALAVRAAERFAVLPQDFTIEGGELAPTLKVRRRV